MQNGAPDFQRENAGMMFFMLYDHFPIVYHGISPLFSSQLFLLLQTLMGKLN